VVRRPLILHSGATWRIRLSLCFLRPSRVHNPNSKSIGSAVFAQLTAECRPVRCCHLANMSEIVHWRNLANTIEILLLYPTRVHNPNDKSIHSPVSAQLTAESPYALQWDALSPSKSPHPMGDLDNHLIHGSLFKSFAVVSDFDIARLP